MALTETEQKSFETRFSLIESVLNKTQTALNNLATKAQLNSFTRLRQQEIVTLRETIAQLENTGIGPALTAHKENASAHTEINSRFFLRNEFFSTSAGISDANKPVKLNASGLIDSTMIPTISHGSLSDLNADDHPSYLNTTRANNLYYQKTEFVNTSSGINDAGKPVVLNSSGQLDGSLLSVSGEDHGLLTGLDDDDHTQYLNNTRGDLRYYQQSQFTNIGSGVMYAYLPVKLTESGYIDSTMLADTLGDIEAALAAILG